MRCKRLHLLKLQKRCLIIYPIRFDRAFKVLKGHGQITEINVAETLKEVRRALLDADVNFKTAKDFTTRVKEKALGENVLTQFRQVS